MFFYKSINYLLLFSYNILQYCNKILSTSVDEMNAYKILSTIEVYNRYDS